MKEEWEVSILLALFVYFAGKIKRRLTQIFAKNKKVLKHGAAF